MPRFTAWIRSNMLATSLIACGVVVVLGVAFLGVAKATDSPAFCNAACHEMRPYHAAWSTGPHKDVACVECHVDPGEVAHLSHKFVALGEVYSHFTGNNTFPRAAPPIVPNARCIRCHKTVDPKIPGFDHAKHAGGRPCATCHAHAGHEVTTAALQQAGFLNASAPQGPAGSSSTTAAVVVDGGAADLAGHPAVVCSRCHTMSQTPCSSCHTPKHVARGECSTCHRPGERFVFTHPTSGVDCTSCHKRPAQHTTSTDCTTRCHQKVGVSWTFTHTKGLTCTRCHVRPAKHRDGACSTCHKKPGASWAFTHPANGAKCVTCHDRPAKHRSGTCATCHHRAGVSWAFTHPRLSANCRGCHARPAGMPAGQCSNCHRHPGKSWAFTHGAIPKGEHTYKSFACVNCHPSGYSTHTCIKCHSSAAGGD